MLEMLEVVGTSADGYTEATNSAVNRLIKEGQKVHFFTVVEQRGSVREGKIKEFQIILKVAVERPETKNGV